MITKPTLVASAIINYCPVEEATVEKDVLQISERFLVEVDGVRSDDEKGIIDDVIIDIAGEEGAVLEPYPYEYIMYEPVGEVVEPSGRKHHIIGYDDQIVECISTTHKADDRYCYGGVEQFDREKITQSEMGVEMFNVGLNSENRGYRLE